MARILLLTVLVAGCVPVYVEAGALRRQPGAAQLLDVDPPPSAVGAARWWHWTELASQQGLSTGRDAMLFANASRAPKDLFWWQLTDGKYMTDGMTCRSFQQRFGPGDHLKWGHEETVPHAASRFEACGDYIKDTFQAYLDAAQHIGRRWSVDDLAKLNLQFRGPHYSAMKDPISELNHPVYSPMLNNVEKDGRLRDTEVAGLKRPCTDLEGRVWPSWEWMSCTPCSVKPRLLGRYLDDYYSATARLPAPARRSAKEWNAWLVTLETFFVQLYELHPFLDGNSRTRLLLLDALLCENGLHPVLGLYNIKDPSPVDKSIKDGLAAWEHAVETAQNPWMG